MHRSQDVAAIEVQPAGPVSSAPAQTRRRGLRRRWWLAVLAALIVGVVAAVAALVPGLSAPHRVARVTVADTPGGPVTRLTAGAITLPQLSDRLRALGHSDLLTPMGNSAYELRNDLSVGPGADLRVEDATILLRSDATEHVRLLLQGGGRVELRDASMSSWSGAGVDTDLADGRAFVEAVGPASRLDLDNSVVAALGSSVGQPGVVWREGAAGAVTDTKFVGNYRGAYLYRAGDVTFERSEFTHSRDDGLFVNYPTGATAVSSCLFVGNDASGLEVYNADHGMHLSSVEARGNTLAGLSVHGGRAVQVEDALLHENSQEGMLITSVEAVTIRGSRVWANASGMHVSNSTAEVRESYFSAQLGDGVLVTGETTHLSMVDDRFDHNESAGLWVGAGSVEATGSLFDENQTGVRLGESAGRVSLRHNQLLRSVKDAVALSKLSSLDLRDNLISESGGAAFSVAAESVDVSALVSSNQVTAGQEQKRVRGT